MKYYLLFILTCLLLLSACEHKTENLIEYTIEDGTETAKLFILNAPTYSYDGKNLELIDSNTLRCDNCYIYVLEFNSRYKGFGNRENQILDESLTVHKTVIVVQNGIVIQAIIDNEWNELKQIATVDYENLSLEESEKTPVYYCSTNEPSSCPKEIDKVCSDKKYDYNNGCKACQSSQTKWYVKGTCDLGFVDKAINDLNKGKITKEGSSTVLLLAWIL